MIVCSPSLSLQIAWCTAFSLNCIWRVETFTACQPQVAGDENMETKLIKWCHIHQCLWRNFDEGLAIAECWRVEMLFNRILVPYQCFILQQPWRIGRASCVPWLFSVEARNVTQVLWFHVCTAWKTICYLCTASPSQACIHQKLDTCKVTFPWTA